MTQDVVRHRGLIEDNFTPMWKKFMLLPSKILSPSVVIDNHFLYLA